MVVTAGCPSTPPSIFASFLLKLRSCGYKKVNVIGAQEAKATVVGDRIREVMGARPCVALQELKNLGSFFVLFF